ncbi:MAG: 2-oxoacid:ferredoxin oxidoreductase subunit beta [Rhodospirillaceae bacterium]|nr:2-oxoacid:ferredoxin oxidoreductase subunit beta [Rhodospirillaceae bacterium]|tara:strand:- start:241 stop:1263 length:1023 start_codon:yes stop_codon:yes gene_type:complete
MKLNASSTKLTVKDYASDQEVRWCPGCGDYAILKAVQMSLANMQADPDNTVFVSGIGCAARFPYYMSTYGFHTIHGRAPAVASGIKLANPDLDVWVVSGDGDALSIGGNHLLHLLRRNVDVQFLLFNNEIYGLTKGQYSPTSVIGQTSPSTPEGSVDSPVDACTFALGCNARFVARAIDIQAKKMGEVFLRARDHKGSSFVEIIQNCIVFNDNAFSHFTDKKRAAETQLHIKHGQRMLYGNENSKGLRAKKDSFALEIVTVGEDGITEDDVLIHDETNRVLAQLLVTLKPPDWPVIMGVIYCDPAPVYEQSVSEQIDVQKEKGLGDINSLLRSGNTWKVT